MTLDRVRALLGEEVARLETAAAGESRLADAAGLLEALVAAEEFPEFLTLGAYEKLA